MAHTEAIAGKPLNRVDGHQKVTGRAIYAADTQIPDLAHAALVLSTIPSGRIGRIDTAAACKSRGVLTVITHRNAFRLSSQMPDERPGVDPDFGEPLPPLQDELVRYHGQPVAMVVATTLEEAIHAASLVKVEYSDEPAVLSFDTALSATHPPTAAGGGGPDPDADYSRGDVQVALASSEFRIDETYTIGAEHHNPMELHATVASWTGHQLTLYDKTQWVDNVREQVALAFRLEKKNVRVVSPFVGGAFGSALRVWPHVLLAALAARHVKRPVKLVLTRAQTFTIPGYRPQTLQKISLGASRDGQLTAIDHEGISQTSTYEEFTESLLDTTRQIYQCPNVRTSYRLAPMNVNTPASMRGPGEASGMFALESALDELAVALKIDPVELRVRNLSPVNAEDQLPWSSHSLKQCYIQAAARFGWSARNPEPLSMRDGHQLIGYGMATATWPAKRMPASVRITLNQEGLVTVETAGSDIGPGTYTALTQIAAEALGVDAEAVRVILGDSALPDAPVQGGSMTIASIGTAVHEAALKVRQQIVELAVAQQESPLYQQSVNAITAASGTLRLTNEDRHDSFKDILNRNGMPELRVDHSSKPGDEAKKFAMRAFGAHFVEVRVDEDLGIIRVARCVSALAAGRIINPKMAHSQAIGGIVGGIGMALLEQTRWDARNGRIINSNLADYHVPVSADIPKIDVFFIDEIDTQTNPVGTKGLAELSIVGVAAAVANAVYHATGKRIRDLPITLEKLL